MLGRLFGRRDGPETAAGPAEHACDLRPGGFLRLGFVAPEGLARAELEVRGVHALDLSGGVRRVLTVEALTLGQLLMWRGERGTVAMGRPVDRPDVERLFDLGEFARLFDLDGAGNLALDRRAEPPEFAGWTAPVYRQEAAHEAVRRDADPLSGDPGAGAGRAFDFYRLVGDRRRHALEAYVHDGGRTDVVLAALLDDAVVEEIWSG